MSAKSRSSTSSSLADSQGPWWMEKRWHLIILFASAFILYGNTVGHEYTQDDPIVLTENMYTTQGLSGISGLFTKDTFYGYFKDEAKMNLVEGGRYRPLSLVSLAIEYEFFGANPFIGHLMNVIYYGLLSIMIYLLTFRLFKQVIPPECILLFSVLVAAIYTFHPVHTEAVANIKGRDEIFAMLFGSLAWFFALNDHKKWKDYLLIAISFMAALLSKENAITLVPAVFLSLWWLKKYPIKKALIDTWPFIIMAVVFVVIRFSVVGNSFGDPPMEMMNNPFVKFENGGYSFFSPMEKYATIIAAIGHYFKLLIIPHPLTHDYYPRAFEVLNFSSPTVLISTALIITLVGIMIYSIRKFPILSFSIGFFFITISIFSNIIFPIGTHLSERFLFMPSLSLAIIVSWLMILLAQKGKTALSYIIVGLLLVAFAAKTISRNNVWKDNFTLFTTDVKTSNNSAKVLNAAAGVLTDAAKGLEDKAVKNPMISQAKDYVEKALQIHPNYKNAWLILGNDRFFLEDHRGALDAYDKALSLDPGYPEARRNKALVLRIIGREKGEKDQDLKTAMQYFHESYRLNPEDIETIRLLGIGEGLQGKHDVAIKYFQRYVSMAPNQANGYVLLSQAYGNAGNSEMAKINRTKALQIDPNAFNK